MTSTASRARMVGACLDDNLIAAYFDVTLGDEETRALFAHVDVCADCARLLAASAAARTTYGGAAASANGDGDDGDGVGGLAPAALGRYRLERVLGMGGMGVVYAGYDPELDRQVAIKLLRPDLEHGAAVLRARLVREAQAMARLSHPNTITVYEVGAHGAQVFIAMELIEGTTLSAWLRAAPRDWRAITTAFLAAGAGLEAAHAAGIVHRDFKPDNVLVSREDRVCVTDFGLARRRDDATPAGGPASTHHGRVIGTPAYMAPEQIAGEPGDERSDVFSFCVALYEALCGVRPFAGSNLEQRAAAITRGQLATPLRQPPRWLRRAVEHGLRARADDRPASMRALRAALAADPTRRRRRWLAAGAAGLLVIAAAIAVDAAMQPADAPCRDAGAAIAEIWNPPRALRLAQALVRDGRGYLADSARTVNRLLDDRAAGWVAQRREACLATRVRGEQPEAVLERRVRCLDARLGETDALIGVLSTGAPAAPEHAVSAVARLPPLALCRDPAVLAGDEPARDPATRARQATVVALVERAEAERAAGQYREATMIADRALADARALGVVPVLGDALFVRGQLAARAAQFADANALLGDAERAAQEAHDDRLAAQVALQLAELAAEQEHATEAAQWLQLAEGTTRRLGGDAGLELRRLVFRADLARRAGQLAAAEVDDRAALAIAQAEDAHAPSALEDQALVLANLGDVLRMAHRDDEAVATLRRAQAELAQALGPAHPVVGQAMEALAIAVGQQLGGTATPAGNAAMLPLFRDQLALFRQAYGDQHPRVANTLFNLGDVLAHLGRDRESVAALEQSVAIYRRFASETSVALNTPRSALGQAYVRVGRFADAVTALEPTLALDTGDQPAKQLALAEALWQTGDHRRALTLARQARQLAADPDQAELAGQAERWLHHHGD